MKAHFCGYCGTLHSDLCAKAIAGVKRVDELMAQIRSGQDRPGARELTNIEMLNRSRQLRGTVTAIKTQGGEVKPDYE